MTNADKYFRNATDEEIAEIVVEDWCELLNCNCQMEKSLYRTCDGMCKERVLDWLKHEAKDERTRKGGDMKYQKKPVIVEAYKTDKEMDIQTLEGTMHASIGDFIITGVNGEQYPCKPDIFAKTYELLEKAKPAVDSVPVVDNITIEELKNDCKRLIKKRLSGVPNGADILNYATAIAELEKNELIKKLADTNPGVFGASSPMEDQLVCNEEAKNEICYPH